MSFIKPASIPAVFALVSLVATPAAAVELPAARAAVAVDTPAVFEADSVDANDHRWRRYRRHNHIDAGDVLAGVLIIGGIAAIANAANKDKRDRDYRDRDYREYPNRDYDYRERRNDSRYEDSRGINRAVEMCVREIERDVRVDSVDEVGRDGDGWEVKGTLYNGERFSCELGADGRIRDLDIDGHDVAVAAEVQTPAEDHQWDDQRYAQARAKIDNRQQPQAQPAYPGGPVDGDLEEEGDASPASTDDGRYDTADSPDFDAA